ncbi:MAG: dual specificity protein phosphatase family protein [Acidobacteria bacterium]|nr:dual specificity protein phosphatase family protein [Acidobacteriota bacterium]
MTCTWPLPFVLFWGWSTLCLSWFGLCYALHKPKWLLRKGKEGINTLYLLLNLPWLSVTYLIFGLERLFSREAMWNQIGDTPLFIGAYPWNSGELGAFDWIIDLTAEFPRSAPHHPGYCALPNLDGMPLESIPLPNWKSTDTILIHCAQGHGRSALLAAFVLQHMGFVNDFHAGLALVRKSRPKAIPNQFQCQKMQDLINRGRTQTANSS